MGKRDAPVVGAVTSRRRLPWDSRTEEAPELCPRHHPPLPARAELPPREWLRQRRGAGEGLLPVPAACSRCLFPPAAGSSRSHRHREAAPETGRTHGAGEGGRPIPAGDKMAVAGVAWGGVSAAARGGTGDRLVSPCVRAVNGGHEGQLPGVVEGGQGTEPAMSAERALPSRVLVQSPVHPKGVGFQAHRSH